MYVVHAAFLPQLLLDPEHGSNVLVRNMYTFTRQQGVTYWKISTHQNKIIFDVNILSNAICGEECYMKDFAKKFCYMYFCFCLQESAPVSHSKQQVKEEPEPTPGPSSQGNLICNVIEQW
jgi:hypothetical protein